MNIEILSPEMKKPNTLVELIRFAAEEIPQRIAIGLVDQQNNADAISYSELWTKSLNVAAWLRSQGLKSGDRMLLIYPTSREFIFGFFGALLAGGIPVPFTPPFGLAKIDSYLPSFDAISRDSGAKICLTEIEKTT